MSALGVARTDAVAVDLGSLASLRAADTAILEHLAARLRRFLVESLATTGGHLGSNLGVVELTIALHRVFESPRDAIVWDTGHQAYVHKLLTGRADAFSTLRQRGGLSGYPSRTESVHDLVENSHASTALSYASGIAAARRLRGEPGQVVAVVGDGSLTGGVALEALSNLAVRRDDVCVVLNDNGRSYAPTVSALCDGAAPGTARAFFEALGLEYDGPLDGHDLAEVEAALRRASARPGPRVVHVVTQKGRGYLPAERDADRCLHDVGPFDPASGRPHAAARPTYTRAFSTALLAEAARRPELVAVTAAMASPTGLAAFAERYPRRFFDVGIAEQHAVTLAAGLAMGGLRPVVCIYSTFLNRAWDQLYYDVGLHGLPVVFCLDRAGVTGDDGPSHHGVLDLMLLAKVPGMTVLAPSSADELAVMLHDALEHRGGPVALRWPKSDPPGGAAATGHGTSARRLRTGGPACLVGVGKLVAACVDAAELLSAAGIAATVWDARCVAPLDPGLLDDAARHQVVVTAEDGIADGGVGTRIASALAGRGPRVVVRGVPTAYLAHGPADELLADLGLDGAGLARAVLDALDPGA